MGAGAAVSLATHDHQSLLKVARGTHRVAGVVVINTATDTTLGLLLRVLGAWLLRRVLRLLDAQSVWVRVEIIDCSSVEFLEAVWHLGRVGNSVPDLWQFYLVIGLATDHWSNVRVVFHIFSNGHIILRLL